MLRKIKSIVHLEELPLFLNNYLGDLCNVPLLFLLRGELGSGKTTFVQQACHLFGVQDPVRSPTFSLLNIYYTIASLSVYHYDLYRLKEGDPLDDLIDLNSPFWIFVEWYCRTNFDWISFAKEYRLNMLYVFLSLHKGEDIDSSREIVIEPVVI